MTDLDSDHIRDARELAKKLDALPICGYCASDGKRCACSVTPEEFEELTKEGER